MKKLLGFILFISFFIASISVRAENDRDDVLFEKIFNEWTVAFNKKNLAGSCRLFSKDVVADYQNTPTKTYATLCDGFKKIFDEPNKTYRYNFKLNQVYRSGSFAAVRITWVLSIYENNKLISKTQDEGLDVFTKDSGNWQIINYLAYPVAASA